MQLHVVAHKHLSTSSFNLHGTKTFASSRELFSVTKTYSLYGRNSSQKQSDNERETEMSECLVMELYQQVSEHFLRISFVEALHSVREQLPKTKKQALRAKVEGATVNA